MSKSVTDGRGREIDLPDRYVMGKTTNSKVYHTRKCRYYNTSSEGGITARRASDRLIEHKDMDKCPECAKIEQDGMNVTDVCEHARNHISGYDSIADYKEQYDIPRAKSTILRHVTDQCNCEHGVDPVEYNHTFEVWGKPEDTTKKESEIEQPYDRFFVGSTTRSKSYHTSVCNHVKTMLNTYPDITLKKASKSAISFHDIDECKVCQGVCASTPSLINCGYIRRNIVSYTSSEDFIDEHNISYSNQTVIRHARGDCGCDCDSRPAKWDSKLGWVKDE